MKKMMVKSIRIYQKYISPMKGTKCPYIPSCSQYGLEAVEKYGALKGEPWRHGESFAAILFPREVMILFPEKLNLFPESLMLFPEELKQKTEDPGEQSSQKNLNKRI